MTTTSETGDAMTEKKQVQCADCWRWIDADKAHTCRQQINANRKRAAESEGFDRTERIEATQRFWETDWETAVLIDDCLGE